MNLEFHDEAIEHLSKAKELAVQQNYSLLKEIDKYLTSSKLIYATTIALEGNTANAKRTDAELRYHGKFLLRLGDISGAIRCYTKAIVSIFYQNVLLF